MSKWAIAGEAQLDALRETPEARDAAIQRLVEAGIIDPTNRQWPKKEDAANYISYWSDVSAKTPTSTDESALVAHAAVTAGWALLDYEIAFKPERVQYAIMERCAELCVPSIPGVRGIPGVRVAVDVVRGSSTEELQTVRPHSIIPKALSAGEIQSFMGQPDLLHGRKFLMSPDTEDEAMFEVVSYTRARDKSLRFEILFEDCDDSSLTIDQEEMNSMLEESYIYPSSST
ncbi:hypothetical protein EW026_g3142 [Hermanssonia centrifuga]|uniref:Uncharacterized protein n=1 Tax=Hermanssonia centrifuga TaxID=98765 RepID=A0A4S4KL31_9APHY|nr:hypothetical protein EW026_g3142 [Hermanssonia centrifuga]